MDIPAGTLVEYFAVSDSGTMYIGGYRDSAKGKLKPGFAAIFDDSGKMVRDLSGNASSINVSLQDTGLPEGDAAAGTDGRFYILEPSRIIVVEQNGDVENTISFSKPEAASYATRIEYSSGLVSIVLDSVHKAPGFADEIVSRLLVFNAQTGEQRGDYVFDPSLTGTELCFNREDGYSVFAIDGKSAAKVLVPLR